MRMMLNHFELRGKVALNSALSATDSRLPGRIERGLAAVLRGLDTQLTRSITCKRYGFGFIPGTLDW
jgi:hypothetical protein